MHHPGRHTHPIVPAVALLASLVAVPLHAGTLTVPGSAPTIQGAIVLASSGDTILVAPGTYAEHVDLLGKRLVIESTGGAAVTIIDAGGTGSAVSAHTGEPAGTTLHGFTLTGGTGQPTSSGGNWTGGGGLFAVGGAHVDVLQCSIIGNNSGMAQLAAGAGVLVNGATVNLVSCTLTGNVAERGAAVTSITGSLSMSGCVISGNTASLTETFSAVYTLTSGTIENCLIVDNAATGFRADGNAVLKNVVFSGNSRWGVYRYGDIGTSLADCQFLGNGLGGAYLGPPKYFGSYHDVRNCVFAEGDDLKLVSSGGDNDIDHCTFDGADLIDGATPVLRNCILRNSALPNANWDVGFSNIEGGAFVGPGLIDADPLWVNPAAHDYRLSPGSPCIDAGDPSDPLDADGTTTDMGAVPFAHAWVSVGGGVAGSAGLPVLVGAGTLAGGAPVSLTLNGAASFQPVILILGGAALNLPFKGGTLWPALQVVVSGLPTDGAGHLAIVSTWPAGLPSGLQLWAQCWFPDAGAPQGVAGSNGERGTTP
jgi:hypothetical protein